MKLIIELSNGTVYGVKKKDRFTWTTLDELKEAIKKGKPLQAEFEKVKTEIIHIIPQVHIKTGVMSLDKELVVPLNKVIEKLDERISELKGE